MNREVLTRLLAQFASEALGGVGLGTVMVRSDATVVGDLADLIIKSFTPAPEPATDAALTYAALTYAADVRWEELAQGSPFTTIDRMMLGKLHDLATTAVAGRVK
jgi:hypothetical protein